MASLDKVLKALEALKLTLTSASSEDKLVRHKEKLSMCQAVTDHLCSADMRSAPNFPNLLSLSIDFLLKMCDDNDSDIRMMADESLNRIIRANMSTMHNTILKIHVELLKEIKKNGKARSLRAALTRFSHLAHMIRPQKGKVYMQTLIPCLINIAKRQEESVLETLASSVQKIFSALGPFTSDNLIKSLLESLLENVCSDNTVVRRTSATCVVHVCISVPKSQVFLAYTLSSLLELIVPVREETNSSKLLGVFNCIRGLLPHINYEERQSVIRGSFGTKRKLTRQPPPSLDSVLQVFELCMEWSRCSSDHNVVSTSLETLHQVLVSAPPALASVLVSPQGLIRSRIHTHHHHGASLNLSHPQPPLAKRSLSEMSLNSSVGGGDESLLFELEEAPLVSLTSWLSDQHVDRGAARSVNDQSGSRPESTTPSASNLSLDSVHHDTSINTSALDESVGDSPGPGGSRLWREAVLEKPLSPEPEPAEPIDSLSPPSSPLPSSNVKQWDIGELYEADCSAVIYTARFLASRFLLGGGLVRVSIRCLAASCLVQLVRLHPPAFFVPIDRNDLSSQTGVDRVSEVLSLCGHPDPQLRGLIRVVISQLLATTFQSCCQPSRQILDILPQLVHLLLQGLCEESSVCVRHSLTGLSLFLSDLLHSDYHLEAKPLLDALVTTSRNPYWLVKVKLLEVVSTLPLTTVHYCLGNSSYQDKLISSILVPALGDSDSRVRKAAASAFSRLVETLYFASDYEEGDVMIAVSSCLMESLLLPDPSRDNDITCFKIRNNLSRVVFLLSQTMMHSHDKLTICGNIEALSLLSCHYKVIDYPSSWQCSVNPSPISNSIGNGGLLSLMTSLLTTSNLSIDLECHTSLLTLAGNLFCGLSQSFLRYADTVFDPTSLWPNIKDPKVCNDGKTLLQHVIRLLSMMVRIMDDGPKITGVTPLKRRPSRAGSPPHAKSPQSPFLEKEKREERNRLMGHFLNDPHCMKLYDLIRSAYNNYRVSLDSGGSEKLVRLVTSALGCLTDLLKAATITSTCSLTEEILSYLRTVFILDSTHSVQVVIQLLKCLFVKKDVSQEAACKFEVDSPNSSSSTASAALFNTLIGNPLRNLSTLLETSHPTPPPPNVTLPTTSPPQHQLAGDKEDMSGGEGKQSQQLQRQSGAIITLDRTALAVHIKLFEPIVIQALKEYTVTSNVLLQSEVLKLLIQLVQLKVNYCLLDSEQIFFKFVLKQFDFLETGQILNAEVLIPEIFHFLSHLSNEKNHSKPVISIPRVIQLCDGLMASGQDPLTNCIPALTPLVEHVFVSPSSTCDAKELDTQREVILAMLLKLAEYSQVLGLLAGVMKCTGWQSDQWKRLYSQTVETLMSGLSRAAFRVNRVQALFYLLNSPPPHHLPHLLALLFLPQGEEQCVEEWLGGLAAVLMSVSSCKEESVLLHLDQTKLYLQEEGDDPLNVITKSKQIQPQQLIAKVILKILRSVCSEIEAMESSGWVNPGCFSQGLLYTHFSDFMYTLIRLVQPGGFEEVGKCLRDLLQKQGCSEVFEVTQVLSAIHRRNPMPLILWSYFLATLGIGSEQLWHLIINQPSQLTSPVETSVASAVPQNLHKRCVNSQLVRRTSILLYCDYIGGSETDDKDSELEWLLSQYMREVIELCYEPPVDAMLRSIYLSPNYSKILLHHISASIVLNQSGFSYRLLHCLEFINPSLTGSVLQLVASSLVQHSNIAIARLAVTFTSRTLEYLLTLDDEQVCNQLSNQQITSLICLFMNNPNLSKRGSVVISLLNKLCEQTYGTAEQESNTSNNPALDVSTLLSINLDSAWLATLVQERCWKSGDVERKHYADLLNKLNLDQIEKVMRDSRFNLAILQHCYSLPVSPASSISPLKASTNTPASQTPETQYCDEGNLSKSVSVENQLPDLYIVARDLLLDKLKSLQTQNDEAEREAVILVPAVSSYLLSVSSCNNTSLNLLPVESHLLLYKFALHSIKVVKKLVTSGGEGSIISGVRPTQLCSLFECVSIILSFSPVLSQLDYKDILFICDIILLTIQRLVHVEVPIKTLKSTTDELREEDVKFKETCLKMTSLGLWLENSSASDCLLPVSLYNSIREVILRLSVSKSVLYYCRVPVEAWPLPLRSDSLPPPIDVSFLRDLTLLKHLINRISVLKWRGRQEFEETWVCLLSALIPSLDSTALEHDDFLALTQLNSMVVDGVSWLVLSTLRLDSSKPHEQHYLHVPRLSSNPITSHKGWPRLKELNDLMLSKLKTVCQRFPLNLTRIDLRPNLERSNNNQYGIGQLSVEYLQYQLVAPEDISNPKTEIERIYLEREEKLSQGGLDVRSCVQFLMDLFSQWTLLTSGSVGESLELTITRSLLCLSDMFSEKSHYVWMLDRLLESSKFHPQFDLVIHQYLTVGICKAAAVLSIQDEETCDKVVKVLETALRSNFPPLRTSGVQGLLYLLQVTKPTKDSGGSEAGDKNVGATDTSQGTTAQSQVSSSQDFSHKVISLAVEHANKLFLHSSQSEERDILWNLALVMYLVECYPDSGLDHVALVKSLTQIIRSPPSHTIYHATIQGMERIVLVSDRPDISDPLGRLALERLSHSDPLITLPALQLLLAHLYSEVNKTDDSSPDKMSYTMEKMETTSILFDRMKKGYLTEVELIVEVVAKVLSDLFPASDILTKVIGEFLSPNHPHKTHMAHILLQCFSQACDEDQLGLLQDWVVHSLNNFSSNLPTAAWCLSCFFISASTNPNLKAVFPLVQSRIGQCDIDDRNILCLAALDFYRQLSEKQQEMFLSTIRETALNQKGPFADIIAGL